MNSFLEVYEEAQQELEMNLRSTTNEQKGWSQYNFNGTEVFVALRLNKMGENEQYDLAIRINNLSSSLEIEMEQSNEALVVLYRAAANFLLKMEQLYRA